MGEAVNGAEEGRGDPLHLFFCRGLGRHLPSPGRSGEDAARKMWPWGGSEERGRGVTTNSPHTRLGPKRVILGSFGRSRPRGHVCMFSNSQAPCRVTLLPPTVPLMVPPLLTGRPEPSFLFGEGLGDLGCLGRDAK